MREQPPHHAYLLDTHTAIWALQRPEALSPAALQIVAVGPNVLSIISYWEVMLKSMKGNLDVGDPRQWWLDAVDQLAATVLPLRPEHVSALSTLPLIHKDPFDRIFIAQATAENLTLVTADARIARYASMSLRIVG